MRTLAVIIARAGSRGLRDKCVLPLCGRPIIAYTISHAQQSRLVDAIVLSSDSVRALAIGRAAGISVIQRPGHLATDATPVADVVRHATRVCEQSDGRCFDAVVVLYGNIPLRGDGAIDRCIQLMEQTGCDSVRTVAPVGKMHPDWMHRLDGDHLVQFRPNSIHRRQDLEPLYYHDAAVIVVKRDLLMASENSSDPHAFFGADRRAVIQEEHDTVDIDGLDDFYRAEALIRLRNETVFLDPGPTGASRRPAFTAAVQYGAARASSP